LSILSYALQACAFVIIIFGSFSAGRHFEHGKLLDEWRRVEQEWEELHREKIQWHFRKLNGSPSNGRRSRSAKS